MTTTAQPAIHTTAAVKQTMAKVSHGRGGAANIGADDTIYTDGGIVREGLEGDQGDGAFSTGRGGLANIGAAGQTPKAPADHDVIPEVAVRDTRHHDVFHTGRGGEGNLHHETSRLEAEEESHKHSKSAEKKPIASTEVPGKAPSVPDTSSSSTTSKNRRSFFGRMSHTNSDEEDDPVKKAKKEEKLAKKAEHEKKYPPPTHGGLGDKLKYKVFGRLYD